MKRTLYESDHEDFREAFRAFVEKEIVPHEAQWERDGAVARELFTTAGANGFLGIDAPEEYGGGGVRDFRFNAVISEELLRVGAAGSGLGLTLHNDIVLPYLLAYTTEEQRKRWLPGVVAGEKILAIAMTEPGIGSDLASMSTTAIRDGDHYVVNGAKTFITNGINADLIVVAVKTDPSQKHKGMSLLVLERGMEGFERGRNLDKLGMHAQDTAELSFTDVKVPVENLLGPEEGKGFVQLVEKLPQERLSIAVAGVAAARATLNGTLDYVKERKAFGSPVGSFQNSKFALAEMDTEIDLAEHYVDDCVRALNAGELTAVDASKAKYWCTELQGRVADRCLQLHGGYGYMEEYPIARLYVDGRISRIYAGANEVMRDLIARFL